MRKYLPYLTFFSILFFLLLGVPTTNGLAAQTLSGRITDAETGEPLPFASIYVEQRKSGTASNADGYFQVKLAPGTNRVVFQYLGYQTQVKTIRGSQDLDIELSSEALDLKEVEVLSGGEDKSYSVIRRAIAKADYHLNQLDRFEADVYIKGTGKVNKIPGILKALAPKEDRKEIEETLDRPFTTESTSKIVYERPNTYKQEVLNIYQIGESDFDAAPYIFTSFYEPLVADELVSPLSPKAFGYYKFELEGVFVDQDKLINKIKVIPRSRGEDVFEGYIYIVQDDWSLHSLDLTTYKLGFQIDIAQTFAEIQEHIWEPITTTVDADGQIFGIAFEFHYLSTISNYVLTLNPDIGGYVEVIDEKTQPEVAAKVKKKRRDVSSIEKTLAEGGEITRKDLRKLMREYEREERKQSDEPQVESNYSFKMDSAKAVQDTAAWAALRPVPLTALEVKGYAIADSIERNKTEDPKVKVTVGFGTGTADSKLVDTTATKRKKGGLRFITPFPDPIFNPVEGYVLGARFGWRNRKKKFGFGLHPRYGFGWKQANLVLDAHFGRSGQSSDFGPEPQWHISGGQRVRQFNDDPAIEPWISTYTNLFSGRNFIRLYQREYFKVEYRKNFTPAFRLEVDAGFEDRQAVGNSANNNWFGLNDEEVYTANFPINAERGIIGSVNDAATARVAIAFRPGLKYEIENGRKRPIELSAPTIGVEIRQGISEVLDSRADFTALEASYEHRFSNGRKGEVDLLVRGGAFLNNASVDFPDFKHFSTSELTLTSLDPIGSFRLLPYYQESTSQEYLEVYGHYQFRKFLLTHIWKLHLMGLKEDLFVNYLYTPTSDNYTEVGYSIDNIFRIFRLEFVTSFRDFKYDDFGIRFSIASTFGRGGN